MIEPVVALLLVVERGAVTVIEPVGVIMGESELPAAKNIDPPEVLRGALTVILFPASTVKLIPLVATVTAL